MSKTSMLKKGTLLFMAALALVPLVAAHDPSHDWETAADCDLVGAGGSLWLVATCTNAPGDGCVFINNLETSLINGVCIHRDGQQVYICRATDQFYLPDETWNYQYAECNAGLGEFDILPDYIPMVVITCPPTEGICVDVQDRPAPWCGEECDGGFASTTSTPTASPDSDSFECYYRISIRGDDLWLCSQTTHYEDSTEACVGLYYQQMPYYTWLALCLENYHSGTRDMCVTVRGVDGGRACTHG